MQYDHNTLSTISLTRTCRRWIASFTMLAMCSLSLNAQMLDPVEEKPVRAEVAEPATETLEPQISFGVFSEPIELTTLIDYVGSSLDVNIVVKGSPTGEIVFNAPKTLPKSKLIDFLDAMLEQFGFTISYDAASSFYLVQPITDLKPVYGTERASMLIIPTPNIKPSLIVNALNAALGGASGGTNPNANSNAIQAVDELGVLIVSAPPRDSQRVQMMVNEFIRLDENQQYIRLELSHIAAPIALDRAIGLVGGSNATTGVPGVPGGGGGNPTTNTAGSLSNIADRITVDPQGNALIFKGNENEIERVRKILAVIDVPNTLQPKSYFAGSSAASIADIAKGRGLGDVILIEPTQQQQNPFNNFGGQNQQFNQQNNSEGQGGPVMVVDIERGSIIYYGTDNQQAQLAALLEELKTEDERIVRKIYGLDHTDALVIQDLLNGIMFGQQQTGSSELLDGAAGRSTNQTFFGGFPLSEDSAGAFDPNQITITADENSNQIIINAPIKQQDEIEALISELDRQRSQVYIQALIVSISDNEDFTLAFETQINAGQYSAGTNFGLSTPGTLFQDPKSVATTLGGLTQAVIMSEYVPIIVNATQTNTDVRILSTPQLLVNNNEESTIASVSEQPFTQDTPSNGGIATSFGGFEEAGTTLTVTPSISQGGFIRLQYDIEFSNFTAASGTAGSPPPRDRRTITGSATIPSDATIVLGGITVEDIRDTVIKVPFLGDIPLAGELFKRTNKVNNRSKLYVFLTPRIMTDPNFNDLKLFSNGPQSDMMVDPDLPNLEPELIISPKRNELPTFDSTSETQSNSAPTGSPESAPELEPVFIELSEANEKGDN
ncbi:MAG: secretin N-terminal domain-containing protein [Phycisphaerales bacterium]|nr:secretin N-terminal domain-containing protein [Phycisphaerales bacterium]